MPEHLNSQATMWEDQVTTQEKPTNNTKGVKQQCKKKWATMQEDPSNNAWTNILVGWHDPQCSKQTLKVKKVCLWGWHIICPINDKDANHSWPVIDFWPGYQVDY